MIAVSLHQPSDGIMLNNAEEWVSLGFISLFDNVEINVLNKVYVKNRTMLSIISSDAAVRALAYQLAVDDNIAGREFTYQQKQRIVKVVLVEAEGSPELSLVLTASEYIENIEQNRASYSYSVYAGYEMLKTLLPYPLIKELQSRHMNKLAAHIKQLTSTAGADYE
jgi:hypothetical protein